MKIKVTVELEEGVKATTECNITTEAVLGAVRRNDLEEQLFIETQAAGNRALRKILNYFDKYSGIIAQYDDNKRKVRLLHCTQDVDEALKLFEEAGKKE